METESGLQEVEGLVEFDDDFLMRRGGRKASDKQEQEYGVSFRVEGVEANGIGRHSLFEERRT